VGDRHLKFHELRHNLGLLPENLTLILLSIEIIGVTGALAGAFLLPDILYRRWPERLKEILDVNAWALIAGCVLMVGGGLLGGDWSRLTGIWPRSQSY
jgi:hypothetical protein